MYLIVGANGFLGHYLLKNIRQMTKDRILATDLTLPENAKDDARTQWMRFDVTKREDLARLNEELKKRSEPVKAIYLAAYHHPDLVLKNPRLAWDINVTALAEFLNKAENIDRLYYPSTEVVYGEGREGRKFKETDPLNPSNTYGQHKSIAERMVNAAGYNVVRFPVLTGPSLAPGKKHFFDQIIETLQNGGQMEMFVDNCRSMIDFDTASQILIRLIEDEKARGYPIVNICGDEALSKYELGLRIAEAYGLDKNNIRPISMDDDRKIFTAKRSKETLLDNALVKEILRLPELKLKLKD